MTEQERYFLDLTGYVVARNALTETELERLNGAWEYCRAQIPDVEPGGGSRGSSSLSGKRGRFEFHGILGIDQPYCDAFRNLIAHPAVVSRLNVMCGPGFRLDHGPLIIPGEKGVEGFTLHGAGDPYKPRVAYHNQDGRIHCNGVTVSFQLGDCNAGDGGFACVPGSHKSKYPLPEGVRTCDDDGGSVVQPPVKAGDILFFMDGAQTHGTLPWQSEKPRRVVLIKYAGRTAVRLHPKAETNLPEIWWDGDAVEDMNDVERAVMYGPGGRHGEAVGLDVDAHGQVCVGEL